jgi:hypothetical protein
MTGRLKLLIKLPCGVFEMVRVSKKFLEPASPRHVNRACKNAFKFCPFPTAAPHARQEVGSELGPYRGFAEQSCLYNSAVGALMRPVSANTLSCLSILEYHCPYPSSWCSSSTRTRAMYRQEHWQRHTGHSMPFLFAMGLIEQPGDSACQTMDTSFAAFGRGGEAMHMPTVGG